MQKLVDMRRAARSQRLTFRLAVLGLVIIAGVLTAVTA